MKSAFEVKTSNCISGGGGIAAGMMRRRGNDGVASGRTTNTVRQRQRKREKNIYASLQLTDQSLLNE
jgi:hypothetical protein